MRAFPSRLLRATLALPIVIALVAGPSIRTLATLLASCPVITRRTGGKFFQCSLAMILPSNYAAARAMFIMPLRLPSRKQRVLCSKMGIARST